MDTWWKRFAEDVFPLLVPRSKWKHEDPALEPGAIVLVKYEAKFGKVRFRMGRVIDTKRDADGLVRTAWVGVRALKRAIREPGDVCRAGLTPMELPVQRLVLVLPAGEQAPEILQGLGGFPPMPRNPGRVPQLLVQVEEVQQPLQPGEPLRVRVEEPAQGEILDLPGALPQRERRARRARR